MCVCVCVRGSKRGVDPGVGVCGSTREGGSIRVGVDPVGVG